MGNKAEIARLRSRWSPERVSALRPYLPVDPRPMLWPQAPVVIPAAGLGTITHADAPFVDLRGFPLAILARVTQDHLDFSFAKSPLNEHGVDVEIQVAESRLTDCRFEGAQTFHQLDGTFLRCTFAAARMREARFPRASFTDCSFEDADLRAAHMSTPRGTVKTNADESRLFTRCSFARANLQKATFAGSILEDCDFRGSRWSRGNLMRTTLLRCDLTGVDLADAWIDEWTRFVGCRTEGMTRKTHTSMFGQTFRVGPDVAG